MDPKLLITLVAGLLCAGWYAWDSGWISGWKLPLPFIGDYPPSAADAMAHCKGLVEYLNSTGTVANAAHAEQVKGIATEIYRGTLK